MMLHGHFRPAYLCNGSDFNGNPCSLMEMPTETLEMFTRPDTIPIFAPNEEQLRFPQSPATHEMQPGAVMLLVPVQGPPLPGFGEPRFFHPWDRFAPHLVSADEATEREEEVEDNPGEEKPEDLEHEANEPVSFSACKARFNGIGNIKEFLEEVLDFKAANEMSDEVALRSFPLLFEGLVKDWWAEKRKYAPDWQSAVKMFRNCYRIYPLQPRIFSRFFCRPQKNETTAAFIQKIRGIFHTLPLPNFTEECQLDLVYAMLHSRIRVKVSRADFKTYTELLQCAQRAEDAILASNPQVRQPVPANPGERRASPPSPSVDPRSGVDETLKRSSCAYCLSYGDLLVGMCRKVHRGEDASIEYLLLEKINSMDKEELSKLVCFKCGSTNIVGLKCEGAGEPVISGNCPLITVCIEGEAFDFIVDTGISYSIASEVLVAHLIANGHQLGLKVLVTPSDGRAPREEIVRAAAVDVVVSDVKIPMELAVIPEERGRMIKNVFGMDFIKGAGLVLDFRGAGTWTVRGTTEEQPMLYEQFGNLAM